MPQLMRVSDTVTSCNHITFEMITVEGYKDEDLVSNERSRLAFNFAKRRDGIHDPSTDSPSHVRTEHHSIRFQLV